MIRDCCQCWARLAFFLFYVSVSIWITGTSCECKQLLTIINTYNNSQYSKIRFYLETFDHNQLKEHLVNHECDIIFSSNDDLPNGQDLVFNKLRTSHFVCVCQVQDPLTTKKVLSLEDLKNHNLIMIDEDWCSKEPIKLQRKVSQHFNYQNITYVGSILVNFLMIKAGMGVSILPDFVYDSTDPDLTTVPFDYDRFLEYGIVYNYNSLSQPGKRFIKWLELYKEFFRNSE